MICFLFVDKKTDDTTKVLELRKLELAKRNRKVYPSISQRPLSARSVERGLQLAEV